MARVLVVEDSPLQTRHLESLLVDGGHTVELARNGVEGLAAVRRAIPDAVLTDIQMPEMNGLELATAVRAEFPSLPLILTTSQGSEDLAVQALRAGATTYVPKRNLSRDVLVMLDEVLSVARARRKQELFLGRMTAAEHEFALENDTDLVPEVVGHVEALMRQMQLFDASDQMRVGVAIHEAVVNGMIHGNLQVSSDLKSGDCDAYHQAIAVRARQEPYASRRVAVTVRAARGPLLEVRVRDQGPGFDVASLPDPTAPANLDKASGRGLLLIRTFFDRVTHNVSGNEITMTKGTTRG